jgi:hypothetical protein
MFGQAVDHLRGQRAFAHISERRGIDDPAFPPLSRRFREGGQA